MFLTNVRRLNSGKAIYKYCRSYLEIYFGEAWTSLLHEEEQPLHADAVGGEP